MNGIAHATIFINGITSEFSSCSISKIFKKLRGVIFLLCFTVRNIFRVGRGRVVVIKVGFRVGLSTNKCYFRAYLSNVFRRVKGRGTRVGLVWKGLDERKGRYVGEGIFSFYGNKVVSRGAIGDLVLARVRIVIESFSNYDERVFFGFFCIALFYRDKRASRVVTSVIAYLPYFFGNRTRVLMSFLLRKGGVILLLGSNVSIRTSYRRGGRSVGRGRSCRRCGARGGVALRGASNVWDTTIFKGRGGVRSCRSCQGGPRCVPNLNGILIYSRYLCAITNEVPNYRGGRRTSSVVRGSNADIRPRFIFYGVRIDDRGYVSYPKRAFSAYGGYRSYRGGASKFPSESFWYFVMGRRGSERRKGRRPSNQGLRNATGYPSRGASSRGGKGGPYYRLGQYLPRVILCERVYRRCTKGSCRGFGCETGCIDRFEASFKARVPWVSI